jgi:DNA-binding transcriptional LysR family regulator
MPTPEWSHLQSFLTLARTRRLSSAGRRLRADHTTVSRHIAALEKALSATLFDRREEGFLLTAEGERLFQAAEQMESLMLDAHNDIVGRDLELAGTERIGVPDGLGVGFLAAHLAHFAALHPGLSIELVALPQVFNLSKREADIAISLSRPAKGRLIGRKLREYSLQLYASKAYLAAHSPILKASDLLHHAMIGYIEDLTPIPELSYLDQIHSSLHAAFSSSTMVVQLEAIRAGAGVGVLPRFLAEPIENLVCVLPESVRLTRCFWLSVPAELHRLARIRAVCNFIAERICDEKNIFA